VGGHEGSPRKQRSQSQDVSPPYDGGIFDSSVKRMLSDSEIPDFDRERINPAVGETTTGMMNDV
jgi:hypothetical protein